MRIFPSLILLSITALSPLAAAQTRPRPAEHPNLNGTWTLNASKSDFGQVPPPQRQSESILQAGEELAIAITLEREETKQHYTLRFRAGGDAMPLAAGSFPNGAPFRIVSVKGEWDGQTLVVTEKVSYQGADGTLTARYTLSGGGKVLTKQTHVSMGEGEFDTRTVYDKQ
jgi:hypothetical protein